MAYDPQNWENLEVGGTPLSADRLNHMEAGIEDAATDADAALTGLAGKQDTLTPGENITIEDGVISAEGGSSAPVDTYDMTGKTLTEVNAWLATSTDGIKRLVGALTIPSGQSVLFPADGRYDLGVGEGAAQFTGVAGTPAPLAIGSGETVYFTGTGAATAGSVTLTASGLTSGDVGSWIELAEGGGAVAPEQPGAVSSGTLAWHARILAVSGTTITLDAPATATVSAKVLKLYRPFRNVQVTGGVWFRPDGGTFQNTHVVRFARSESCRYENMTIVADNAKYALYTPGIYNSVINAIHFVTDSDGVHINGPAQNVQISHITGTVGDDLVALLSASEYAGSVLGSFPYGPIEDIDVEHIDGHTDNWLVKITSWINCKPDRLHLRHLRGSTTTGVEGAVMLAGWPEGAEPRFDPIGLVTVDDIAVETDNDLYAPQVYGRTAVENLSIAGVRPPHEGDYYPIVIEGKTNLSLRDSTLATAVYFAISDLDHTSDGSTLLLENVHGIIGTDPLVLADERVGIDIIAQGGEIEWTDPMVHAISVGSNTGQRSTMTMNGLRIPDAGYLVRVGGWTEFHLYGDAYPYRAGWQPLVDAQDNSTVSFYGDTGHLNSPIPLIKGASAKVRSYSFNTKLDVAVLSTTGELAPTQMAYNTNAALDCGVGPVIYNGTDWVSIADLSVSDLDAVLTAGNYSDQNITIGNDPVEASATVEALVSPGQIGTFAGGFQTYMTPSGVHFSSDDGAGAITTNLLTGVGRSWELPDESGTLALLSDITGGGSTVPGLALDKTGATNVADDIQTLYDAGGMSVNLEATGTYLLNSAIFTDRNSMFGPLVIEGNGATLVLGTSLPTASSFDTGSTKVAFFPNTVRAALSGGVVTVNDANRATGSGGKFNGLVINNVRVETANSADVGLVYANRNSVNLSNVNQKGGRFALSWFSYSEPMRVLGGYFETQGGANQVADAWYVHGRENGDGIEIASLKCSGAVGGVSLRFCNGATLTSLITARMRFTRSSNITVVAPHMEAGIYDTYTPNIELQSSEVNIVGGVFYPPTEAGDAAEGGSGAIVINDTDADAASDLSLSGTNFVHYILGTGANGPHIYLKSINNGTGISSTHVSARNCKATLAASGSANAGWWRRSTGLTIRSYDSGITAAFNTNTAKAQIATGDFDLQRTSVGGGSAAWQVLAPGIQGLVVKRPLANPGSLTLNTSNHPVGELAASATYYTAALRNAAGEYTGLPTVPAVNATPSNGTIRILVQASSAPATLVLWRKIGSGVESTPTAYVELPFSNPRTYLMDTGDEINGQPWITTSVPVPNTVAASNSTTGGVTVYGVAVGGGASNVIIGTTAPPVNGTPYLWVHDLGSGNWTLEVETGV